MSFHVGIIHSDHINLDLYFPQPFSMVSTCVMSIRSGIFWDIFGSVWCIERFSHPGDPEVLETSLPFADAIPWRPERNPDFKRPHRQVTRIGHGRRRPRSAAHPSHASHLPPVVKVMGTKSQMATPLSIIVHWSLHLPLARVDESRSVRILEKVMVGIHAIIHAGNPESTNFLDRAVEPLNLMTSPTLSFSKLLAFVPQRSLAITAAIAHLAFVAMACPEISKKQHRNRFIIA